MGAGAGIFRMRNGSEFAKVPVSGRRRGLSIALKTDWIDSSLRVQTSALRLRRDNCRTDAARQRLEAICKRRLILETRLRTHYPSLRNGDSLFPEFDSENFIAIGHRGYARLLRELRALQNRLYDCTKFDKLIRYRCANLFFLILPEELFRDPEIPAGWGALVESNGALTLMRKPIWYEIPEENRVRLLHRIAVAGTRALNRKLHDCEGETG